MIAGTVFFLFAVAGGDLPGLTPLAMFETQQACEAAAKATEAVLATGENGAQLLCASSDALRRLVETK